MQSIHKLIEVLSERGQRKSVWSGCIDTSVVKTF